MAISKGMYYENGQRQVSQSSKRCRAPCETVPSPHGAKRKAGLFDKSVSTDFVIVADVKTHLMSRRLQKVGLRTKNYVLAPGKLVGIMDH